MSYYFIARINIKAEMIYQKYLEAADRVFSKFNGKYLAVDNTPLPLEGKTESGRVVIIEFPSNEEFEKWYYSKEYQEILKYRLEGADCNSVLVKGSE